MVVFGMSNAGASGHYLYFSRFGDTLISQTIFMSNGSLADISDDFHIPVGVHGETGSGLNAVIIPDNEWWISIFFRMVIIRKIEMVMGIQPAVVVVA